jgi:23S rRNA (guanine745-N1)-methyltransferase
MISVDPDKEERLERSLAAIGEPSDGIPVVWRMQLSEAQARDLLAMGPNAGRLDPEELETAARALDFPLEVTGSVRLTAVERRP